jgi:serine phosphatase RsbU (regulator of sigma subunit)/anti-sigma regulatory factor (Ser/Thr protein kinase)
MDDGSRSGSAGDRAAVVALDGPASLGHARRAIAEHLRRCGHDAVVPDAQLVASELLTNAFLHAGGPAELEVTALPGGVRIAVQDASSAPPTPLAAGEEAMTGRGLHLVEGLAARWGVTPTATGKVVWAELVEGSTGADGAAAPAAMLDEEGLLALWDGGGLDGVDAEQPARAPVDLGYVPTALLRDAKRRVDDLVREFALIAGGSVSGASETAPAAVTRLIDVVVDGFAAPRQALKRLARQALDAGHRHVDIVLPVPADLDEAIRAGEAYLDALEQADAYCRAARLLTLEAPPQHRIFHRWYVGSYLTHLRSLQRGDAPPEPQPFDERLLEEVGTIARAHDVADRAARLHALAVALSAALTPEAVAAAVLDEGVTAMGASGGVVLLASDSPTLAIPGAVGHDEDVMARLRDERPDAGLPAAHAMRTGEAVWLETPAERRARFPDLIGFEPATVAMCAVPVSIGRRRLGALRFSFTEPRLFDEEERRFVTALAAQTAQALHRAELHRQRLDVAERLQATLLPARLPDIPGIDVGAAYRPLTDAMEVGGDFYDVWRCAEDHWALAIGDVCGSGPEAAAVTGLVRHTLRALTATSLSIEAILHRLNDALIAAADDPTCERFCTVTLGFADLTGDRVRIDLVSGGHPDPVVVRGDGTVEAIPLRGTILGVLPDVVVDHRQVELAAGETLVLVTDGATEARAGGAAGAADLLGVEGVRAAAGRPATTAAETVAAIEQAVLAHGEGRLHDDMAVLALRRR